MKNSFRKKGYQTSFVALSCELEYRSEIWFEGPTAQFVIYIT